jgi:integral membrane protein
MATPKTPVASALKLYKVASFITGFMLLAITVLFAIRLSSQQELWLAGPPGFLTLEHYSVDAMGNKVGLPSAGLDLTMVSLILHGWFYVLYLYSDYRIWSLLRWNFKRFLIIAAGGVVPLLSFFTEHHFAKVAAAQIAAENKA